MSARLARALLRLFLPRDHAAALIGDLTEELGRRGADGRLPRLAGLRLAGHALVLSAAAARTAAPRAARAARDVVRDAGRGLMASPGTTGFAVLILTLGIAATTVTFSVVDHVVLRPLPFPEADRIVAIEGNNRNGTRTPRVDPVDFHAWQAHAHAFGSVAMWHPTTYVAVERGPETDRVASIAVTSSLFDVLGVRPAVGRGFDQRHHTAGQDDVVILGHGFWQRYLGGSEGVVGTTISTGNGPLRVVGVMPRGFTFPLDADRPIDLWRPYVSRPGEMSLAGREGRTTDAYVVARLRDGVTIQEAQAQVAAITARQAALFPRAYDGWAVRVMTLRALLVGPVERWMLLLLAGVGLVMTVACVNVANLLLARATVRARDFAVRAALGGGRRRLVATLMLEGLMLAGAAAVLGVIAARWGVDVARATLPAGIARADGILLDARVLGTAVASALATGLVVAVAPAWQASRANLTDALKDAGASSARPGRRRWQHAFLVIEVAFVVLLLVVSGLFVASFARITGMDLGFERRNLVGVRPLPALSSVPRDERALRENAIVTEAVEAVRALPDVARVSISAGADLPFGFVWNAQIDAVDPTGPTTPAEVDVRGITGDYFDTAEIAIVRGRTFGEQDLPGQEPVAIVDERSARLLFGDGNPIGARVRFGSAVSRIVGIAANVRLLGPEGRQTGQLYYALSQNPRQGQRQLIVRTHARADRVVPAIEATVGSLVPPGSRPAQIVVLEDRFGELTADRRFTAALMSIFGALALAIGAAGVYSVMSFVVSQQTRDLGVRAALGASRPAMLRLVLGAAARHVSLGAAIGLAGAWAISSLFTSLLFGVTAADPAVYGLVALAMTAVCLASAYLPARRASRADPIAALRMP